MIPLGLLLSLLLPAAGGVLLTVLLMPAARSGPTALLWRVFIGSGLGLGLSSCLQFLCLLAGAPRAVTAADLLVCLVLGLALWRRRRKRGAGGHGGPDRGGGGSPQGADKTAATPKRFREGSSSAQGATSWLDRLLGPLFGLGLLGSLVSFAVSVANEPQGRWDAWLIWNMRARFLYRGGAAWRDAFASGLDWSHWDYPLLLPLSIVRGWLYAGQEELHMPAVIGLVFTLLTLGLLVSALGAFRHRSQGWLAGLLLLGTPFFIAMGAAQFADVPLAFFMLATAVLLVRARQSRPGPDRRGALILAGLAAGCAAWTKNEGLLFLPVVVAALALITGRRDGGKRALEGAVALLAGMLPVLLVVLFFKLRLAPTNDIMAGLNPGALADKVLSGGRWLLILRAFFVTALSFTQGVYDMRWGLALNLGAVNILAPLAYLLLAGLNSDRRDRDGLKIVLTILALMLAGYFGVYVLTPLDLNYHLLTSLNRLFLQLWPSFLLAVFLVAGNEGGGEAREAGAAAGPTGDARKGADKRREGRGKQ